MKRYEVRVKGKIVELVVAIELSRRTPYVCGRLAQDRGERRAERWKETVGSMKMIGVCGEVPSRGVAGIVVSEDQGVSRRDVVVRVLESGGDRSKLKKFFEVDARSVREGNGAIHNCAERRALFISERVRDNVRGVEDMAANVRNVVGYGHTSSCSRW